MLEGFYDSSNNYYLFFASYNNKWVILIDSIEANWERRFKDLVSKEESRKMLEEIVAGIEGFASWLKSEEQKISEYRVEPFPMDTRSIVIDIITKIPWLHITLNVEELDINENKNSFSGVFRAYQWIEGIAGERRVMMQYPRMMVEEYIKYIDIERNRIMNELKNIYNSKKEIIWKDYKDLIERWHQGVDRSSESTGNF
jgi:hypothetical protein